MSRCRTLVLVVLAVSTAACATRGGAPRDPSMGACDGEEICGGGGADPALDDLVVVVPPPVPGTVPAR